MLQKSQEGLLRTVLYQILQRRPNLIPKAYPETWRLYFPEEAGTQGVEESSKHDTSSLMARLNMTSKNLMLTLVKLCNELAKSNSKICFFMDGLDENSGHPDDMIALIHELKALPNVKICVSSRPWNEFEQEFGRDADGSYKLNMQQFNEGDIRKYVNDSFESNQNYHEHEEKNTLGRILTEEIVQSSSGVFLWVFLVVRSFREGLMNGDSIARLRARLVELPKDLEQYFERIIFYDITGSYHSVSADMFRLALGATRPLSLFTYWLIGKRGEDYQASSIEMLKSLTPDKLKRRLEIGLRRLNACCKGILELQPVAPVHLPLATSAHPSSFSHEVLFGLRVDFLHRTVYDFLLTDETQAILEKWRPLRSAASVLRNDMRGITRTRTDQSPPSRP